MIPDYYFRFKTGSLLTSEDVQGFLVEVFWDVMGQTMLQTQLLLDGKGRKVEILFNMEKVKTLFYNLFPSKGEILANGQFLGVTRDTFCLIVLKLC